MMFWIVSGLALIIPSAIVILVRKNTFLKKSIERWFLKGRDLNDPEAPYAYPLSLLGLPLMVTGFLLMIPTWVWWDFAVGFFALAVYEFYLFLHAKRMRAEHDLKVAQTRKGETA